MVSFVSCILSLQVAASRLVYAFARDEMIAGSGWLAFLSPATRVPTRALMLSGTVAAVILLLGMFFQDAIAAIVSFAVIGIYAAFQMIVAGAILARLRGWVPNGPFVLGRWGMAVNVAGLVFGISAIVDMIWPRSPDQPWYIDYAMPLTSAAVVAVGLAYMVLLRPYNKGTAPAGDAGAKILSPTN